MEFYWGFTNWVKGAGMDASNVGVFVFFEDGLKLLLELLEPSHLMRFALVPTTF